MENIKFISNLKGFSGCNVGIYSERGINFVRKISKSKEYNSRLDVQINKQKNFLEKIANAKITAPKILRSGCLNGLNYFDMEYIQGVNLVDYIYDAKIPDLREIAQDIGEIIYMMKNSPKESEFLDIAAMVKKIETIHSFLLSKKSDLDLNILKELKMLISTINQNTPIQKTFCHGDLTMENIIIDKSKKRYYLIDFLDSFIEHYWFDIAKLFQDIEGKWYKFRNPHINMENMAPKMDFLNEFFRSQILIEESDYNKNHNLFLALNFSRILPYAEEKDSGYLVSVIEENIKKFRETN